MKKVYLFIILAAAQLAVFAQAPAAVTTFTSIGNGDWTNDATWSTGQAPIGQSGTYTPGGPSRNQIVIAAGTTVTLNFPTVTASGGTRSITVSGFPVDLIVYGVLKFDVSASKDEFLLPSTGSGANTYYSRIYIAPGGVLRPTCGGTSGITCSSNDKIIIGTGGAATTVYTTTLNQIYAGSTGSETSAASFSPGAPLPVKFANIKASEKGTGVQIDWTSYSELNLANYQIERSADGIYFTSIGEVTPRNVSDATNYNFFDALPLSGTSFYRIRNNDIDGKSGLSSIVKLNLNKNIKTIGIYPNPVIGNRVSFQTSDLAKGTYNVEVINAYGNRVFQQSVNHVGGAINQLLNLPSLQSGQYTLRITGASTSTSHKISILQ